MCQGLDGAGERLAARQKSRGTQLRRGPEPGLGVEEGYSHGGNCPFRGRGPAHLARARPSLDAHEPAGLQALSPRNHPMSQAYLSPVGGWPPKHSR